MFASPYIRRRASALSLVVCLFVLGLLVLPGISSGAHPPRTHVVQPGETLWSIASDAYGGDAQSHVEAIAQASHLESALIVPGEHLVLP
jgi:LysM repeat protein